jgi:cobalt-zinc-cadmium efflux system membrane fusion protein
VAPALDPRTRTLKARAEVPNPDGLLRAGTFAKALVTVSPQAPALLVPKSAVQWEGCCNVAFVRRSDVVFEPRKLRLGPATDRHYVVLDGLAEGDEVVTTGSFLLKTEILKGSIGAGCCEVEPGKR